MEVTPGDAGVVEFINKNYLNEVLRTSLSGLEMVVDSKIDSEAVFPADLKLDIITDNTYERAFPAQLEVGRTKSFPFNIKQFTLLSEQARFGDGLRFGDIARLYIGGSLAYKFIEQSVSPQESTKIDRLFGILTDVDAVATAVRVSDFHEDEQMKQLLHIIKSDDLRACDINAMRFAIGMVLEGEKARGNDEYVERVQMAFRQNLNLLFQGQRRYTRLFRGLIGDKKQAYRRFASHVRNVGLAICFPMSSCEINTVLDVCSQIYNDESFESEIHIPEEEVSQANGFTHEGA